MASDSHLAIAFEHEGFRNAKDFCAASTHERGELDNQLQHIALTVFHYLALLSVSSGDNRVFQEAKSTGNGVTFHQLCQGPILFV